jgi:hypothetical protein
MTKMAFIRLSIIFVIYIVMSQILISEYRDKIKVLKLTNTEVIKACSTINEGEDLDEVYIRRSVD